MAAGTCSLNSTHCSHGFCSLALKSASSSSSGGTCSSALLRLQHCYIYSTSTVTPTALIQHRLHLQQRTVTPTALILHLQHSHCYYTYSDVTTPTVVHNYYKAAEGSSLCTLAALSSDLDKEVSSSMTTAFSLST